MDEGRHFDALIVVTPADCERILPLYPRLVKNFENGKLCFIGAPEVGKIIGSSSVKDHAVWIDENALIPFNEVHACMTKRLSPIIGTDPLPRGITGWYYQQFLKMQYAFICKDEYYMVWDGDTIPCRKIKMFGFGEGKPFFDLKHEYHPEYFDTIGKILPGFKKVIERSFISEHMLFDCDIMREMISDIEKNVSIPGEKYWEKIINSIDPEKIYDSSFSEFETYGTYATVKYPDVYEFREWHSFRLGASFFDMNTICDRDFRWLSEDFDAISFEKNQSCEGNLGYFDNPKVQKKISAKKLLQEAQVAFEDAYKEVWDDDLNIDDRANVREGSYQQRKDSNDKTSVKKASKLKFPDNYFQNESRCGFHITAMIKRLWAVQLDILFWINEVCQKYGIRYIICYGSLIGAVRHKGYIPWDDDIDIGMLRGDYERFLEVVPAELPPHFYTRSLLPGALPPKEMAFNINNGTRLDTSPEFLERFHGCPYATGVDVFVFDRVPDDPEEYDYQDRLIRMLDRLLMLQWEVDAGTINKEKQAEYNAISKAVKLELDYTFNNNEPISTQILRLLDLACSLCEDCGSKHVENREQVLYYGEKGFREDYFTDRIWVPFENVMDVPIPRDYETVLSSVFGDYRIPRKFTSQHDYPIYHNQRDVLYKAYNDRGWAIPDEFLEYDENGELIVNPDSII